MIRFLRLGSQQTEPALTDVEDKYVGANDFCKFYVYTVHNMNRNFKCKAEKVILPLYKSIVRPHPDHCVQARTPHYRFKDQCHSLP